MRKLVILVAALVQCTLPVQAETLTERLNRLHGGTCAQVTAVSGQQVGCFIRNDPGLSIDYCQKDVSGTEVIVRFPSNNTATRHKYDATGVQIAMDEVAEDATC